MGNFILIDDLNANEALEIRLLLCITQTELAEKLGCSRQTVAKYENGHHCGIRKMYSIAICALLHNEDIRINENSRVMKLLISKKRSLLNG